MGTHAADRILAGAERPARPPFRRPSGRVSYPRRVTLDLDDERYEWLKEEAWQSRTPGGIAGLLRAVIDVLRDDPQLAHDVVEAQRPGR